MGRIGARLMTSLSVFAFSVFTFLIGTSPGATMMKWFRFGLGLGEGPAGIGAGALLKAWFPRKEQGTATGIYMAASQVAVISVPPICVAIMIHWGWRMVFYSFAVPGVIIAVIWYILVRNRPEESPHCNAREQEYILQSSPEGASAGRPSDQIHGLGGYLYPCQTRNESHRHKQPDLQVMEHLGRLHSLFLQRHVRVWHDGLATLLSGE